MFNANTKPSQYFRIIFSKAWLILTASNLRAQMLREKANNVKIGKNWIQDLNKRDAILHQAEIIEWRGRKVWDEIHSYRGKHLDGCVMTSDNLIISDIRNEVQETYEQILPKAKKLAGTK